MKNLVGHKFGRLTVINYSGYKNSIRSNGYSFSYHYWDCKCECGKIVRVLDGNLKQGSVKSCGCLQREAATIHGFSSRKSKLYYIFNAWNGAINRCYNKNIYSYKDYGARGIKVCSFIKESCNNFFSIVGERPDETYSLDRINNDGHYSCGKCEECLKNNWKMNLRWETRSKQAENKQRLPQLEINGKTKSVLDWALEYKKKQERNFDYEFGELFLVT